MGGTAEYGRYALIIDSAALCLGGAAMRLLAAGIDVLYATDLDEADLLARQESDHLGALLVPVALSADQLDAIVQRVCPKLAAGARSLVPVGAQPEPPRLEALRAAGIAWRLWEPFDEREMRFVVSAAMAGGHEDDRRRELRVPTAIPTTVFMGRHRKEVVVHDLSAMGAYLATTHPFLAGSRLHVEIPLEGHTIRCKAEVVDANTADQPVRDDVPDGMHIAFTQLSAEDESALRAFALAFQSRFRL